VLLADDFAPLRHNLTAGLTDSGNLELAGEASNGREAVELARVLRPDVILMDYRMPEIDGVAAATRIQEENPRIAVIVTSLSFERPYVLRALAAGARGYLAKDDALAALNTAIQHSLEGRCYLSPSVAASIRSTAPPNLLSVTQEVLWTFDREAPALLHCARSISGQPDADAAVSDAFRSYWMALRDAQTIPDPQTWLLLSLAARLFPAQGEVKAWSLMRAHPRDRELRRSSPRLSAHVAACSPCHLAWTLAAHDPSAKLNSESLRDILVQELEAPDEVALFLAFAERQAGVIRLAASELAFMLGSAAGKGWMRREASAGSWLGALLGARPATRDEAAA
jgi:DNA-binding NarL/FixJ family response regulator